MVGKVALFLQPWSKSWGVGCDLAHKESQREDSSTTTGPCWLFAEEKMGMAFTRHQVDQGLENEGRRRGGADEAAQQQLQRPLEAASLFPYAGWLKLKEEHRDVEDFMEAIFLLASCRLLLCLYTTSFFSLRKEIPSLALE